jgi:hypothetical protein
MRGPWLATFVIEGLKACHVHHELVNGGDMVGQVGQYFADKLTSAVRLSWLRA